MVYCIDGSHSLDFDWQLNITHDDLTLFVIVMSEVKGYLYTGGDDLFPGLLQMDSVDFPAAPS